MRQGHLYSDYKEGVLQSGPIQMVWFIGAIGVFVLLIACINFMNLSTARSERRAKEVGIRKTMGSVGTQLILQFFSESLLTVLLAFALSLVMVQLALPFFNDVANKQMSILWNEPFIWLASILLIIITALVAGSYPAFYLSSFKPIRVLKGTFKAGRFASLPRKVLVVVQFTVSITLIIGTIIVYQQIQFAKDRPIGYDREGLVMIPMKSLDFYGEFDVLRTELKRTWAIEELSESSSPLTEVWSDSGGFDWKGKDPALQTNFPTIWVTHEYGKTVNWKIKEGRDFSREFSTDSTAILINEAGVKFMGVKDPVGMEINWFGFDGKLHVIGVVRDLLMESPYSPV